MLQSVRRQHKQGSVATNFQSQVFLQKLKACPVHDAAHSSPQWLVSTIAHACAHAYNSFIVQAGAGTQETAMSIRSCCDFELLQCKLLL
jgi:hypothetical protein